MVVAVLIVGIIAAVSAPRFSAALNARQAEAAARLVAADLNYLRRQAIARGKTVVATFNDGNASYSSADAASADRYQTTFARSLTQWSGNVHMQSNFDGSSSIGFDLRGLPWTGTSRLVDGSVLITSAGFQWRVDINPTTGIALAEIIPPQ
ncbi:MAG: GspH/FimT family pseudopilin [Pirellulaceae bacterium]